jgi:hypothetical protein
MKVEYTKSYGKDIYQEQKVALYNKLRVSEQRVNEVIDLDGIGEPPDVILITKQQYENVFLTGENEKNETLTTSIMEKINASDA